MAARELAFTVVVHDDKGAPHVFVRGATDVPAWAAKKITNPDAWVGGDAGGSADAGGDDEPKPYSEWLKADLEAEVDRRNEGRSDDGLIEVEAPGNKPDLIAALEADDAANSGA